MQRCSLPSGLFLQCILIPKEAKKIISYGDYFHESVEEIKEDEDAVHFKTHAYYWVKDEQTK